MPGQELHAVGGGGGGGRARGAVSGIALLMRLKSIHAEQVKLTYTMARSGGNHHLS